MLYPLILAFGDVKMYQNWTILFCIFCCRDDPSEKVRQKRCNAYQNTRSFHMRASQILNSECS
jgi:hypothetical protein